MVWSASPWMRTAAGIPESIRSLFRYLADHGSEHGIDPTRLGVRAASANVMGAWEYLVRVGSDHAVGEGVRERATYEQDPDLAPLRDDPRFSRVLARLDGAAP
jgi:hypothetical protein